MHSGKLMDVVTDGRCYVVTHIAKKAGVTELKNAESRLKTTTKPRRLCKYEWHAFFELSPLTSRGGL